MWPPATFIGKYKKNRTKRNPLLFDSLPTCCVYWTTWNLGDTPGNSRMFCFATRLWISPISLKKIVMVRFTLQCNPTFERISRNINAENSHRSGEEYTYCLPKGQYKLYTSYCRLVSEVPIDFLLNMASSSIIATNIIIIIAYYHRRRNH